MIKTAINYLINLGTRPSDRLVVFEDADGNDRHLIIDDQGRPTEISTLVTRAGDPLRINTLTGLIDYIKANIERRDYEMFLQVYDENTVLLKGTLDGDGGRETLVVANAIVPDFAYDHFLDVETLNIALQSKFEKTDDRDVLLKVIGSLKEENVRSTGDDGVSQAVTIKTGVASAGDVLVPNPVRLAPFRTFLEVDQPASDFIFRMKDGPRGAIFEADGGAWRNEAIGNVRDYLAEKLAEEIESKRITIIA